MVKKASGKGSGKGGRPRKNSLFTQHEARAMQTTPEDAAIKANVMEMFDDKQRLAAYMKDRLDADECPCCNYRGEARNLKRHMKKRMKMCNKFPPAMQEELRAAMQAAYENLRAEAPTEKGDAERQMEKRSRGAAEAGALMAMAMSDFCHELQQLVQSNHVTLPDDMRQKLAHVLGGDRPSSGDDKNFSKTILEELQEMRNVTRNSDMDGFTVFDSEGAEPHRFRTMMNASGPVPQLRAILNSSVVPVQKQPIPMKPAALKKRITPSAVVNNSAVSGLTTI